MADGPVAAPRLPTPINTVSLEWANQFIRALTAELGKLVQPIGQRYIVTGFGAPVRTFTGPSTRTATCQVGTVTVKTDTPEPNAVVVLSGLGGELNPLGTPANTGNVLATLIEDLQTRGWLS